MLRLVLYEVLGFSTSKHQQTNKQSLTTLPCLDHADTSNLIHTVERRYNKDPIITKKF